MFLGYSLFVCFCQVLPKIIEKLIKNMKVLSRCLKPIKSIVYDCLGFFYFIGIVESKFDSCNCLYSISNCLTGLDYNGRTKKVSRTYTQ